MKLRLTRLTSAAIGLVVGSGILAACGDDGPAAADDVADSVADAGDDLDASDPDASDPPDSAIVDTTPAAPSCTPRATTAVPAANFFSDISDASGIRVGNYLNPAPAGIVINDHSRLAFGDLNGDRLDDIVMHSLFPNAQAGVPFEHLVFLNNGDGTYRDHSTASGLRDSQTAFFAFGDVDNDGDQDIFAGLDIQLGGAQSQVWLNDGNAVFTQVPNAGVGGVTIPAAAANAIFFDYDGDALLDLFVGNGQTSASAPDWMFKGNGDGTFTDVRELLQNNGAAPSNGSVGCDYDNDGDLDLFISTYGVSVQLGANILWENNFGVFTNVAVARGFASLPGGNPWIASTGFGEDPEPGKGPGEYIGSNGFGIDCGDINNDGLMDVYLTTISHPGGNYTRMWSDATQVLINGGPDAGFAFTDEARTRSYPYNEGDVDGAMVDFDNDGWLDLSVSRDNKYESGYDTLDQKAWFGLMHQQADGSFKSVGPESGINEPDAVNIASLIDCTDGNTTCPDGEACLANRCRIPCSDDTACTSPEICDSRGFCKILATMRKAQNHAWSDIDRDGDMDLLVGGRDTGGGRPNFLFRNDIGQDNRWIGIHLVGDGQTINRDAIGARVTLTFAGAGTAGGDEHLIREVRSSRGMYNSADMRTLLFGLGDRACDYTATVRWPDGTTVELPAGALTDERYHTLTYPDVVSVDE